MSHATQEMSKHAIRTLLYLKIALVYFHLFLARCPFGVAVPEFQLKFAYISLHKLVDASLVTPTYKPLLSI